MDCAEDFNAALQEHGLPPAYRYETAEHQVQSALPGNLGALEAFRRGLPALFEPCRIDPNRDGFAAMVASQPEKLRPDSRRHGRTAARCNRERAGRRSRSGRPPVALWRGTAGTRRHAPLSAGRRRTGGGPLDLVCACPRLLPGPAWLLVPRNGEEPPYAYGYL